MANAEIRAVKIYCPNDKKHYMVEFDSWGVYTSASDCEMCGSHGEVSWDFDCKCGNRHEIKLSTW